MIVYVYLNSVYVALHFGTVYSSHKKKHCTSLNIQKSRYHWRLSITLIKNRTLIFDQSKECLLFFISLQFSFRLFHNWHILEHVTTLRLPFISWNYCPLSSLKINISIFYILNNVLYFPVAKPLIKATSSIFFEAQHSSNVLVFLIIYMLFIVSFNT